MHIKIHDDITLQQIKDVFASYYPFLKLEFFSKPHQIFESSEEKTMICGSRKLKEINPTHTDAVINIHPTELVSDLENEFQTRFGLPAQVFRKEKGEWSQTTGMDVFSLKDVNDFSKNDSDAFLVEDYDEGFDEEEEL